MELLAELRGRSPQIKAARDQVVRLLRQSEGRPLPPILIEGETGTGKGLLARLLHQSGARRRGPLVELNCAAIPGTLLEAELFGFERGAFTDAREAKVGLFQAANGGTLFLDEVGLLPEALQAKLLKAIEDKVVRRLGSTRVEPVDASLIAATNSDLSEAVEQRRFRADLYHRLAVLTLRLPPLRAREDDITFLAEFFLDRACREYRLPGKTLSQDARAALTDHRWPGNVRELANLMERTALLSETSAITRESLGLPATASTTEDVVGHFDDHLAQTGRTQLLDALRAERWNISRAASRLGISRGRLRYQIARHDLRPDDRPARPSRARTQVPKPSPRRLVDAGVLWDLRSLAIVRVSAVGREPDTIGEWTRDLDAVVSKIASFGGVIEEIGSTDLVAVFGFDVIEDAARRAALAALAIQHLGDRASGARAPSTKAAIHAGQHRVAFVGGHPRIDSAQRRELWRLGERLLDEAAAGTILVSHATASHLARRFEIVPIEGIALGQEPIYRLTGLQGVRFGVAGQIANFVGRWRKIETLQGALVSALEGRGRVVDVVAEAGLGKSRLLFEFSQTLNSAEVTCLEAHCETYGPQTPYLPIAQLIKAAFGVEHASDDGVGNTIRSGLHALDLDGGLVSPLLGMLGIPFDDLAWHVLDPPAIRERIIEAVLAVWATLSRQRPLILIVEDVHWVDGATRLLLERLNEALSSNRMLLVMTRRPEPAQDWIKGLSPVTIDLAPLPTESAEALVTSLLGSHPSLTDLRSRLVARAGGNPFFLEETIKGLIEAGHLSGQPGEYRARTAVHTFEVPPTVHAVLQARIDRLPQPERQALEHTALLGLAFTEALLEAMMDLPAGECRRRVEKLLAADLLYDARPAAAIYRFRHALVLEVAYAGVPEARRKELHGRALVAFEAVARGRVNDHAEVMAQHAELAERRDKAVDYSRAAAAKAWARGALAEAVQFGERALEMSTALPGSRENIARRIDARLDLHAPLFAAGQIARLVELHEEAERMARETNDRRRLGRAAFRLAAYCSLNAQYEAGIRYADEALEIASDLEDRDLRIVALYMLSQIYWFCGNHPAMARCGQRIVDGADAERAQERLGMSIAPYVMACGQLAHSFALRGEFGRALAYVDRAGTAADRTGHVAARVWAAVSRTDVLVQRGDYADARPAAELAVALTQEHQLMMWLPTSYVMRGRALVGTGEVSEGLAMVQQGVAMYESLGVKAGQADFLVSLGESLVSAGRYEEATRAAEAALAVAAMAGQRTTEVQAACVRVEARLGQDDARACQDSLDLSERALARAADAELHPFVARLTLVRARALRDVSDAAGARAAAERALGRFMAMGMRSYVEQTRQYFPDLDEPPPPC